MLRVAPLAGPLTPRTIGFGDAGSMVAAVAAVGANPLLQFAPSVQSELTAPVHVWADADPADRAVRAAVDMLASNKWSQSAMWLAGGGCRRARSTLFRRTSSECRRIVTSLTHSRMTLIPVSLGSARFEDANL